MDIALVYIVAGLSSRFGGKIKPLAKVGPNDETLIEYSLNQAFPFGFTKIIFVVGEQTKQPFQEKFGNEYKGIPIQYVFQNYNPKLRDRPWGTCDAICSAVESINEPFVVCTGDDIYGEKTFEILTNHLKESDDDATATVNLIKTLPETGTVNRGLFKTNDENYIIDGEEIIGISKDNFIEKGFTEKSPTSGSIFALHPKTLRELNNNLNEFKKRNSDSRRVEAYLNIELINLIKEGKIKIKNYQTDSKLGITNPEDLEIVRNKLKQNKTKFLVTGGAGFIGSQIVDLLVKKGHPVVIIDNLSTGKKEFINTKVKFYNADITNDINEIFEKEKPDIVIHMAAQIMLRKSLEDPIFDAKTNILGTINVLEACRKNNVKKIIYTSTMARIGEPKYLPADEKHPLNPCSPYGISKHSAEHYVKMYNELYNLDYLIFCFGNVYGKRDNSETKRIIPTFIEKMFNNEIPTIFGDGNQTRDFIYVDDLAEFILNSIEKNPEHKLFNLSNGEQISMNEIFKKLKKLLEFDKEANHIDSIKGEVKNIIIDTTLAQKELGWKPAHNFDQGLKETIEWFKEKLKK